MPIRDNDLVLECRGCDHVWWEKVDLPMELGAFTSRLKGMLRCPNCGRTGRRTIYMLLGGRREEVIATLAVNDS